MLTLMSVMWHLYCVYVMNDNLFAISFVGFITLLSTLPGASLIPTYDSIDYQLSEPIAARPFDTSAAAEVGFGLPINERVPLFPVEDPAVSFPAVASTDWSFNQPGFTLIETPYNNDQQNVPWSWTQQLQGTQWTVGSRFNEPMQINSIDDQPSRRTVQVEEYQIPFQV
jgi:hypothetical protein